MSPRSWRRTTWAFLVWTGLTALVVAWVVGNDTCSSLSDPSTVSYCEYIGFGLVGLALFFWLVGAVLLAVIRGLSRLMSKPRAGFTRCPVWCLRGVDPSTPVLALRPRLRAGGR